ncbi:hypothetical protein BBJ28_00019066 [Nothophytophthora sp. Chile5]|nr:hypothetical protein BBJ28_00019066 [Nothophytophthora sp. Chile5]
MNAQSRRSGPPGSMTARKSASVSTGGVNARRIAAARAVARQAKEQEEAGAEEEQGHRCGNPFCRKQLDNRYARFCEDSAMCQRYRALKLQCQANAEAAAKAEDDEDDRPLARLNPGKQKLKKKTSKTKTLILGGENKKAAQLKESEVSDKPFAIPRRKRSEATADAASTAVATARTSVLEADSETTSASNNPKRKQKLKKKKKRQQKQQAEEEETEAEAKRRRKRLKRARDAAAASAHGSTASSPERPAADASLNDLSSAQASSASSAEEVTSVTERLKKRSLGQHPRDPRARRPPRDVAIRETGSDAEMGKTAAAAAAVLSTKKRRLSRRVSADDVLPHPASSPLAAAPVAAPAAAQLPPDTSWKIPGSRAARAATATATTAQTIKRMGIELVALGVSNQAAGFAGGGRYVQSGNRSATQSMRTPSPLARPPHPTKPTSFTPAAATSTPTINGPAVATAAKPPLPLTSASPGLHQATATRLPAPEAPPPLPPTEPTRTVTPTSSPVPNPTTVSYGSSSTSVAAPAAAAAGTSTRERISTSDYLKRLKTGGERRPGASRDGQTASLERSGSLAAELSSALPAGSSSTSSAYPARHPEYHRSDSAPLPSTSTSSLDSRPREDRGSLDPRRRPPEDEKLSNQPRYGDEDRRIDRGGHRGSAENRGEFVGNDVYTTGQREGHHFPPPRDRYPSLQRSSSAFSNGSSRDGGYAAADTHFSPSSSPGEQPSYWRERPREDPPERFARSASVADPPFVPQHAASPRSSEGRWVDNRDRNRPDRDIWEIEQATFSYHESFLVHMLSTFIQKLPHALGAVFNATKKPRKMNWYIKYAERIERICEPYVRVKVESTKAVVTVRDREWLTLEGSSTVTLYTEVIKSLLAEAVSWRELKDEAEKALEHFRSRFDNANMSFVFLRAWNALKHQRECMSLPRQANYSRGDRLHHWNFVVGKVEIGSGSHEENREAFRLATVKALDFLLNLSSDRYGSHSAGWRPNPEHKP